MTISNILYNSTQILSDMFETIGPYTVGGVGAGVKYNIYRGHSLSGDTNDVFKNPRNLLHTFLMAQLFNIGIFGLGRATDKISKKFFAPKPTTLQKYIKSAKDNTILLTLGSGIASVYSYNLLKN